MAPHSSTLAWKIPGMEEPGRLQSMGSLRVRHDWATSLSFFTFMHWRKNGIPLQCSCLENPREGGTWWAAVYGVAQSRTQLKRLSSSSRVWEKLGAELQMWICWHVQGSWKPGNNFHLNLWFFTGSDFVPQGSFDNVWSHFFILRTRDRVVLTSSGSGRGCC